MELNLITGSSIQNNTNSSNGSKADPQALSSGSGPKIMKNQEKTMMDLRDVQAFLYMMIGSDVKIEKESGNSLGVGLNKTA